MLTCAELSKIPLTAVEEVASSIVNNQSAEQHFIHTSRSLCFCTDDTPRLLQRAQSRATNLIQAYLAKMLKDGSKQKKKNRQ